MYTASAVQNAIVNIDIPYCQMYSRAMKPAVAGISSWLRVTMISCENVQPVVGF